MQLILWLFFFLSTSLCPAQEVSFEQAMGQGTAAWKYILTPEDNVRIRFFKQLYEKGLYAPKQGGRIPKTMHFIWLGPKPFPKEAEKDICHWIDLHPGWNVKFWTDKERPLPDPRMEMVLTEQFPFPDLEEYYFNADNFAERSDVLRYAILASEGGVYVDHDMKCLRSIDRWQEGFDFFCGLEPLGETILSSSVNPGTNLVGSVKGHPVLEHAIAWLQANWKRVQEQFPGKSNGSVLYRIKHRTAMALDKGIERGISDPDYHSIVLPARFFNCAEPKDALYALHAHRMSWKKVDKEQKLQTAFEQVCSQVSSAFLWACALGVINLYLGFFLYREMSELKKGVS